MKLSTLARRLAEKTNTPVLEEVILGEASFEDLPGECIVWTGAKHYSKPAYRYQRRRNSQMLPVPYIVKDRPVGVIRYAGKRHHVHRLVFQLIFKPPYEFRLFRQCGTDLCVNPLHWHLEPLQNHSPPSKPQSEPEPPPELMSMEWTRQDVVDILELKLMTEQPKSFEEVLGYYDEDVDPDLVREVLIEAGKGHLT